MVTTYSNRSPFRRLNSSSIASSSMASSAVASFAFPTTDANLVVAEVDVTEDGQNSMRAGNAIETTLDGTKEGFVGEIGRGAKDGWSEATAINRLLILPTPHLALALFIAGVSIPMQESFDEGVLPPSSPPASKFTTPPAKPRRNKSAGLRGSGVPHDFIRTEGRTRHKRSRTTIGFATVGRDRRVKRVGSGGGAEGMEGFEKRLKAASKRKKKKSLSLRHRRGNSVFGRLETTVQSPSSSALFPPPPSKPQVLQTTDSLLPTSLLTSLPFTPSPGTTPNSSRRSSFSKLFRSSNCNAVAPTDLHAILSSDDVSPRENVGGAKAVVEIPKTLSFHRNKVRQARGEERRTD